MKLSKEQYKEAYEKLSPPSPSLRNVPAAFAVGGFICLLGQLVRDLCLSAGLEESATATVVSCSLIFLGALLTALKLFEKIAKFAGAGTLVPITGFANSIVAPAIEFKTEGYILGTCVKMFTIAGPVLAFGISSSVLYGVLLWLLGGAA